MNCIGNDETAVDSPNREDRDASGNGKPKQLAMECV
jgi:hypothetical protein